MSLPTIFDACRPRADILQGAVAEGEFAADLARVLRGEAGAGISGRVHRERLPEGVAVTLGFLFRTLAPMRNRDRMWAMADGIEAMAREEASYWLGMAIHRRHPRRVLASLRMLLTGPVGAGRPPVQD